MAQVSKVLVFNVILSVVYLLVAMLGWASIKALFKDPEVMAEVMVAFDEQFIATAPEGTSVEEGYDIALGMLGFVKALVVLHLGLFLVSTLFTGLAIITKRAVFALVAAIGYTLTGFIGPTLVSTVLGWIGYVRQRKIANVED